MIRALIIDPQAKTITERHIEPTLDAIRACIGTEGCVQAVRIKDGPVIWIDEEGLLKDLKHGWIPNGWGAQAIMGVGVVTDCDDEGYPSSTKASTIGIASIIHAWHAGPGPEPQMNVYSVGDKCQMCSQRDLTKDDFLAAMATGRPLCARCRRA